jgi:hypothetical protein
MHDTNGLIDSISNIQRSNLKFDDQENKMAIMCKTSSNDQAYPKLSENKSSSLRNNVLGHALTNDYDLDSELSSSTMKNAIQGLQVSRNHLFLNIILRI